MKHSIIFLFSLFVLVSCSSDDEGSDSISDQVLTGTLQGESFTFVAGKAFETETSAGELAYSLNLTNVAAVCDDFVGDFDLRISVTVPQEVGVFTDINIVDQNGNDTPFNNLGETVEITSLTSTSIAGKMKLSRSNSEIAEESIFEGTFTLPICQ